ncbi:SLBB domain-containing protein [Aliagarivorans marinus]|uniref:SLBB domain-containing protein n=1 Tax=Aliagarivorans marinus TaxID=561965 RepID=UPI0003F6D33B|nr:SLBB domain-containing protein [Aliagarivorans marinus]
MSLSCFVFSLKHKPLKMTRRLIRNLRALVFPFALLFSLPGLTIDITPQMLEQFQQLPPAQQQALAQQYGIDPSILMMQSGSASASANSGTASPVPDDPFALQVMRQEQSILDSMQEEEEAKALKPFGYDLFLTQAQQGANFTPVTDVPVPDDYVLGPGDTILVQLFGKQSREHRLEIDRQGKVKFPDIGPVNLGGLRFSDAREVINEEVSQKLLGQKVYMTIGELRTIRVFVAGDANYPGSYTVNSLTTASQALFLAGGIKEIGSLRNVQVKRGDSLIANFDLYDLLLRGDASGDVSLQSGDVVFVPALGSTATVEGSVRRPAIYELKQNETIGDLLEMAGGALPDAYPKASVIERVDDTFTRHAINIDLSNADAQQQRAQDGDRLLVRSGNALVENSITLVGAVARPGIYQWREGLRVQDLLSNFNSDLLPSSDPRYAIVIREAYIGSDIDVKGFKLAEAVLNPHSPQNIELQANDKLMVFNLRDELVNRRELARYFVSLSREQSDIEVAQIEISQRGKSAQALLLEQQQMLNQESIGGVAIVSSGNVESDSTESREENLRLQALLNLFTNERLIALSANLKRDELLTPVISKLESQASYQQQVRIVGVVGEVNYPGVYPLVNQGRVEDLILLAGGLKESAFMTKAELTRTETDYGAHVQHLPINLNQVMAGDIVANLPLLSKDRLNVLTQPNWQENPTIELRGEFNFPGVYSLRKGETLSEVIERAGGFTEHAYPYGAVFTREFLKRQEELEIQRIIDRLRKEVANRTLSQQGSFASAADSQTMLAELEKTQSVGRLVIDLERVSKASTNYDFPTEEGDMLYVPPRRDTIAVMGEVQHPTSHRFNGELTIEEYLKLSGGMTRRADKGRIYVIRGDGSVLLPKTSFWFGGKHTLHAGDTVIVPLKTDYKDGLTLWSQVTNIVYNSAVALAALNIF